jgi:hypothetical protein
MLISFDHFQWLLAMTMIAGLLSLLLPLVRIVKYARLPLVTTSFILVPLVNVAWLLWVGLYRVPNSHVRRT